MNIIHMMVHVIGGVMVFLIIAVFLIFTLGFILVGLDEIKRRLTRTTQSTK